MLLLLDVIHSGKVRQKVAKVSMQCSSEKPRDETERCGSKSSFCKYKKIQWYPQYGCDGGIKKAHMHTTTLKSIYRSSSSSPAIPWELWSFPLSASELIPGSGEPHAFITDCHVLSPGALVRNTLTGGEMGIML